MSTFFICKAVGDLGGCAAFAAALRAWAALRAAAWAAACGLGPRLCWGKDTLVMASGDAMLITSWS